MDADQFPKAGCCTSKTLLERAGTGDEEAWRVIVAVYEPLVRSYLGRSQIVPQEIDDLTQDVLAKLIKELPHFKHGGQTGSFRSWLRTITVNRAREFWRAGKCRTPASGGSDFLQMIEQLADPRSPLSAQWDQEHDNHVLVHLLELVDQQFERQSVHAFRLVVLDRVPASTVAVQLNMTVAAVYSAKARILRRLREEANGLIEIS